MKITKIVLLLAAVCIWTFGVGISLAESFTGMGETKKVTNKKSVVNRKKQGQVRVKAENDVRKHQLDAQQREYQIMQQAQQQGMQQMQRQQSK